MIASAVFVQPRFDAFRIGEKTGWLLDEAGDPGGFGGHPEAAHVPGEALHVPGRHEVGHPRQVPAGCRERVFMNSYL